MKYLIKNALILDKRSPYYTKKVDFLVSEGRILEISKSISPPAKCEVISGKKLILSPAFVDINAQSGEPNNTEAETLRSLIDAGLRGGFAFIAHQPTENASFENKSSISFLQSENSSSPAQIIAIGSITLKHEEKKLAEIMDMKTAGAKAFSTGNSNHIAMDTFSNALLYSKGFGGKMMIHPEKRELSKNGQVNQGKMSISMGYKGIPQEAESIAVNEIIQIAEFNQSEVLMLNITAPDSIERIAAQNKSKKRVYTSTSSLHLFFDEHNLHDYDTNFKLNPPLRNAKDVAKLKKAALEGKIDIIYSQHVPCTAEEKNLEFDLAKHGSINIQTAFLACLNALGVEHIEQCIALMSTNPAHYLQIDLPLFAEDTNGSFTLVDMADHTDFDLQTNRSKSVNSPFFGHRFEGKIKGVISNNSQIFF